MALANQSFQCNLCGALNDRPKRNFDREEASCVTCGSSVRTRSLLRVLSRELFQMDLPLPAFPKMKSIRGLGISDLPRYAAGLETKFDYRNTSHDREPKLDLMNPPADLYGQFDFVIVSEVLEHVPPPVESAFVNAYKLLKPSGGVVIATVPYSIENRPSKEHFPSLHEFAVAQVGDRAVLINRTADGSLELFEDLVFHIGAAPALELREFSEKDLRALLERAGFDRVTWYGDDFPPYGILWQQPWSLPFAIRKREPHWGASAIAEVMAELMELTHERNRLKHHRWSRIGRRLGTLEKDQRKGS